MKLIMVLTLETDQLKSQLELLQNKSAQYETGEFDIKNCQGGKNKTKNSLSKLFSTIVVKEKLMIFISRKNGTKVST